MSRTKPTPAPWHYEVNAQGNVVIWATRNGDDDKHILGVSQFGPLKQREADARHICSLVNEHAKTAPTADSDIYYLQSIYRQLRSIALSDEFGPTLGTEVLADNLNWLDNFIERAGVDQVSA